MTGGYGYMFLLTLTIALQSLLSVLMSLISISCQNFHTFPLPVTCTFRIPILYRTVICPRLYLYSPIRLLKTKIPWYAPKEKASYYFSVFFIGFPFSLNSSPLSILYFLARPMMYFKSRFLKKLSGMFVLLPYCWKWKFQKHFSFFFLPHASPICISWNFLFCNLFLPF